MTSPAEVLDVVVGAFVDELARAGVRHVCACPGSRSTPLAIKLAAHPSIKLWMHLDERSAAYFGLGLARALRTPVGLLATSGTASANFFPAVVEAAYARVPLVVMTADRPHELRDSGAPQTIDQLHLYGKHARWFFDLPEPELSPDYLRLVRTVACRAVAEAAAEPAGAVHLNWPFRDPLIPLHAPGPGPARGAREGGQPYVAVRTGRRIASPELIEQLAVDLSSIERGLILCGPQDDPDLPEALTSLAGRLGYPVLADPLSGVRCGAHDQALIVSAYDAFLRDAQAIERLAPEVIVRLGAVPTSKSLLLYLQRYSAARHIVVDPGGWREPTGLATDVLHVDPRLMCAGLAEAFRGRGSSGWTAEWLSIDAAARHALDQYLCSLDELFEGRVLAGLPALLPDGALLYAGNSMPVRDLDSFLPASPRELRCLANRGANGIDGVVSSALGASAARCAQPVVLVIGDVSFYHDLNGLLAARQHGLDLLVVLLNNDGGGIFSFLPQAESGSADFEALFGTPHGLDFRPFVEGYGGGFVRLRDWSEFGDAVRRGLTRRGLQVIEVPTQRARNVKLHRDAWRAVAQALAPAYAG